jgi:hypothetical protein
MTLPPTSISHEEEQERFYAALGKAITQWQLVEGALALVFCRLIGNQAFSSANMAFHAAISFTTKLEITNAAAISRLKTGPLWSEWTALHNKASRGNNKRNQLVHSMLAVKPGRPGYRYHLRPNVFDMRKTDRWAANPRAITEHQITAMGDSFEKLSSELIGFALKLQRGISISSTKRLFGAA